MLPLLTFLTLLLLGYLSGQWLERRHYRSIIEREQQLQNLPHSNSRDLLLPMQDITRVELLAGSVVISIDYFKRVVAILRSLVGGPVASYETLIDRARREAILRLKQQCPDACQLINIRIETSAIHNAAGNGIGSVELLAYGTAIYGRVQTATNAATVSQLAASQQSITH